ncbi:MAG: plastocyanin/azurin family copper-binding protein [Solirubrobacteraceae bacterium]
MPRTSRHAVLALAAGGAVVLAACGSSKSGSSSSATTAAPTTSAAAPAPASGGGSTVQLSADPGGALKFTANRATAKAGTVTVLMRNPASSGLPHGIAVQGNGVDKDGKIVQPGGTSTDTVKLKPGTYTFYCPVPGHKAAGMQGTLVVS